MLPFCPLKLFPIIFVHWFSVIVAYFLLLFREREDKAIQTQEREVIFTHKTDVNHCLLVGILLLG